MMMDAERRLAALLVREHEIETEIAHLREAVSVLRPRREYAETCRSLRATIRRKRNNLRNIRRQKSECQREKRGV
jgi:chromosome segregation ATPase